MSPSLAASAGSSDAQAVLLGLGDAGRARSESHDDRHAGVLEVQRMGVALGAVADDGDGLAVKQ